MKPKTFDVVDPKTGQVKHCVALIRKLTERECFRLMGVPEEDIVKLAESGVSRSGQYKLAGNSIVAGTGTKDANGNYDGVLFNIFRKMFIDTDAEGAQMSLFGGGMEKPKYDHEHPLRVMTLCSGYDSQCIALEQLKREFPPFDYELVAWSEYEPETPNIPLDKQAAVVAHNAVFPQWADRNWGDMTKIDWSKVPPIDLLFYSTPCFVAGTMIMTDDGFKPIEEIKVDDMVLTHVNQYRRVLQVGKKPSTDIIKVRATMCDEIFCTPNHPFYVRELYRYGRKSIRGFREPKWKNAGELSKGDYLGMPVNNVAELPTWAGTTLHRGTHYDAVNELSALMDKEAFWYVMGRYVGDGWQRCDKTHKAILIAFYEEDAESLTSAVESLGWNYTTTCEKTCNKMTIYGKELCEFVSRYGKYAHGKHIDMETLNLPTHLLVSFLEGYLDSDGCYVNGEYRITTVSRELAYGVMQAVAKCFHRPSRIYKVKRPGKYIIEEREVNQRDTYTITWHTDDRKQDKAFYEDGYVWYPLKDVSKTNRREFVYNMEVEADNSYTANGAIVHNCQSISQAGLQHGFIEGSGTRSSIIWNVRDALMTLKPKYAVLENVAAMVSAKFLPMFNLWRDEVGKQGYISFADILNAKSFGTPQNRERIFLVSVRDDGDSPSFHFPEPFPLTTKLADILEDSADVKYYLNPNKVSQFVEENIVMIEKYTREGEGVIEKLPDHLREWLDNYPEESDGEDSGQTGEDSAESI